MAKVRSLESVQFSRYLCLCKFVLRICNIRAIPTYRMIRGFSFAKSFMELYKQSTKKSTQKSKALRKKIYNNEAKKME